MFYHWAGKKESQKETPSVGAYSRASAACTRWLCRAVGMLELLPFGRRKSLTLKRVSRQLSGPHYIVQLIALSTRNFTVTHRLLFPFAKVICI